MAAAKKEVTDQLENVSNKYFVWENPENIPNPYDDEIYWNLAKYIEKLHDTYTKILTRSREITKYAEIKKDDAHKVYAKNKDIVASDEDFFVEK